MVSEVFQAWCPEENCEENCELAGIDDCAESRTNWQISSPLINKRLKKCRLS